MEKENPFTRQTVTMNHCLERSKPGVVVQTKPIVLVLITDNFESTVNNCCCRGHQLLWFLSGEKKWFAPVKITGKDSICFHAALDSCKGQDKSETQPTTSESDTSAGTPKPFRVGLMLACQIHNKFENRASSFVDSIPYYFLA